MPYVPGPITRCIAIVDAAILQYAVSIRRYTARDPKAAKDPSEQRRNEPNDFTELCSSISLKNSPDFIKIGKQNYCKGKDGYIYLNHESVARMHAVIERCSNVWRVIDLGSNSGTKVNGKLIDKNSEIKPGNIINFGVGALLIKE